MMLMFALLGGHLAAIPHSHNLGTVAAGLHQNTLPHFHLNWLSTTFGLAIQSPGDVPQHGRSTSTAAATTTELSDADSCGAVTDWTPPHDADAVYLVAARAAANVNGEVADWGSAASTAGFQVPQVCALANELFHLREPKSNCLGLDLYLRQNVIRI